MRWLMRKSTFKKSSRVKRFAFSGFAGLREGFFRFI
jgi:hypothetical protein